MKITRRDLDPSILEKIDLLDNVAKTYDGRNPDGFVSYGPNGFYFKKTNDTFLKKVFDENELVSLEKALESNDKNVLNTNYTDFRADKKINNATRQFMFNTEFSYKKDLGSKITHYKSLESFVFTITIDGLLHRFNNLNNQMIEMNLLKTLAENFNLASKIYSGDIVDFDILDINTVILATNNFGVYKVNIENKTVELLFVAERVRKVKITYTKTLFVMTDDFCAQYDISNGNRIEKYSNISNRRQLPLDAVRVDGDIFVLGAPVGIFNLDNILHLWKLDDGKVSYNSADSKIEKFSLDNRYQIMFIAYDSSYIYLSGLFKDNPFILSLRRETLRVHKLKVYENLKLNVFTDFRAIDGRFFVLSSDLLYVLNDEEIEERLKLEAPCSRVKIFNGEVVAISDSKLVKFQLIKFAEQPDTLSYEILNQKDTCNNLDILIKDAGRNERVTLFDAETGKELSPSFYMLYKGNAVIKLMNCKANKILLKLNVSQNSSISGIVVRRNNMFLR